MSIVETQELAAGDIIEINVGYSMILPHFYIIEGFTPSGKSAYIWELASEFDPSDPPSLIDGDFLYSSCNIRLSLK